MPQGDRQRRFIQCVQQAPGNNEARPNDPCQRQNRTGAFNQPGFFTPSGQQRRCCVSEATAYEPAGFHQSPAGAPQGIATQHKTHQRENNRTHSGPFRRDIGLQPQIARDTKAAHKQQSGQQRQKPNGQKQARAEPGGHPFRHSDDQRRQHRNQQAQHCGNQKIRREGNAEQSPNVPETHHCPRVFISSRLALICRSSSSRSAASYWPTASTRQEINNSRDDEDCCSKPVTRSPV